MEKTKYTPGPWEVSGSTLAKTLCCVVAAGSKNLGDTLAIIPRPFFGVERAEANARLMAAAPDLLESAIAVLDLLESEGRDTGVGGPLSDLRHAVEIIHGA